MSATEHKAYKYQQHFVSTLLQSYFHPSLTALSHIDLLYTVILPADSANIYLYIVHHNPV